MNFLRQLASNTPQAPEAFKDSSLNQISLEYTYKELQEATQNFDESFKLGSGSFGGVFRGVLHDGTEVAVKVLDVPDEAGFEEEVKVLSKFRHPHLVILMGFARHGAQRLLVYELLSGGDVHRRLQRCCVEGKPFLWHERVSIALDAACGLSHLHHASPKVFHRDIKCPNILLDKNGTAKMADFGLACLSHASAHRVKQASGTVGYACPLYVQRGVVTEGSEVYSFGMVLLELLTALPPAYMGPAASGGAGQQIQYLVHHIKGDVRIAVSLADKKAQWTPTVTRSIAELSLQCIRMEEESRPNFSDIVRALRAIRDSTTLASALPPSLGMAGSSVRPMLAAGAQPQRPGPANVGPGHSPPAHHVQFMHCPGRPAAAVQPMRPPGRPQYVGRPPAFHAAPQHGMPPLAGGIAPPQGQVAAQQVNRHPSPARQPGMPALPQRVGPVSAAAQAPPSLTPQPQPRQVLLVLDCIFSEGANVAELPLEQRRLVHHVASGEDALRPSASHLSPLRVGRAFQATFLDSLVVNEASRSTISREHFRITAEEACGEQQGGGDGRLSCSFVLTNLSGNGTQVNTVYLHARGDRCALHHGDAITLSRTVARQDGPFQAQFLQFRFDLAQSCVREASRWQMSPDSTDHAPSNADATNFTAITPHSEGSCSEQSTAGSIAGLQEAKPVFVLEVCGPGVNDQVPIEGRRIPYAAPLPGEGLDPELYNSLIVGRAYQLDFWQEVLNSEAFNTLSRQHFEMQVWRGIGVAAGCSFLVRNLSDVNPVHVRSGPQETADEPAVVLERGEQRHLLDGDEIVLNFDQQHTFWLIFRDLTRATARLSCAAGAQAPLVVDKCSRRFAVSDDVEQHLPMSPLPDQLLATTAWGEGKGSLVAAALLRTSSYESQVRAATVLRPPVAISVALKDEDEISTSATPLDLPDEADEDFALVMKAVPSFGCSPTSQPCSRLRSRSRDWLDVCEQWDAGIGPGAAIPSMASSTNTLLPPARLVRDSRGVREEPRHSEDIPLGLGFGGGCRTQPLSCGQNVTLGNGYGPARCHSGASPAGWIGDQRHSRQGQLAPEVMRAMSPSRRW